MVKQNLKRSIPNPSTQTTSTLYCIPDPKKPHRFICNTQAQKEEEEDITEYDISDPTTLSEKLAKHEKDHSHNNKTSVLITSIVLTALVGGFGFAVAYIILYVLYDWITIPDYSIDLTKLFIGLAIMILLLVILVISSYFLIKRKIYSEPEHHQNKEKI